MRAHSSSAGASSRVSARGPNGVGFGPSDDAIRHVGTLTILSGFGFAASSLLVASSGVASMDEGRTARGSIPQTAFGENVSVDPATLKQLARDIAGVVGSDDDDDVERTRARALRILAQVTLFVDYHDDIIAVPEIASALIRCLEHSAVIANDPGSVGTHSTALSLQCLADLAKERTVREAIVKSQGALIAIPAALDAARWTKATRAKAKGGDASSKGGDASSNDEDDDASGVASAARLAAELAGDADAGAHGDHRGGCTRRGRRRGYACPEQGWGVEADRRETDALRGATRRSGGRLEGTRPRSRSTWSRRAKDAGRSSPRMTAGKGYEPRRTRRGIGSGTGTRSGRSRGSSPVR